ncbi:MAG: oligosaccharide flippase family protein [Candidatus Bathyarchaeia archaeon]
MRWTGGRPAEGLVQDRLAEVAVEAARGGLLLFAGNTVSTVVLAVGAIVVARLLGPEAYGLYALSAVGPGLFLLFTDFGVDVAVTRFSAKLRAEGRVQLAAGMLRSAILFKLVTVAVVLAVSAVLSESVAAQLLNRPGMGFLVRLAALAVPFQALLSTANSAFLGLDRVEYTALALSVQSIVKAVSGPLLVLLGFGVVGAVAGYVLGCAAGGASAFAMLFKHYRSLGGAVEGGGFGGNLRVMVAYGLPLYASGFLGSLLVQYQGVVLPHFASNAEIGSLTVAMQFAAVIGVIAPPMTALFPAFSKLNPRGLEARRLFELSVRYTSLLVVPVAVAVVILSRDLIFAVYGACFSLAPLLLSTYGLTFLYAGIGLLVVGSLLLGAGETRLVLKANLVNLAFYMPLVPALTALYGAVGAVLAGLVSNLSMLVYQLHGAKAKLGVSLNPSDSSRIYVASALSAAPTLLFLQASPLPSLTNVFIGGSLFLFTYLTAAPLLRAVHPSDISNIAAILSRLRAGRLLNPIVAYEARLISAFA